ACTVGAVVACMFSVTVGGNGALALFALAVTVLIRPIRRPWWDVPGALAVGLAGPAAGLLLATRGVAGVIGGPLAGDSWADGLNTVVKGRCLLTETDLDVRPRMHEADATENLFESVFDKGDRAQELWFIAWCNADARQIWRASVRWAMLPFAAEG